jgi:ABC-type multidrug transport system permease subunit
LRTLLLFSLPLVMTAIFALAFGSGGAESVTIRVLLFDEDDSLLSKLLEGSSGSSERENLEIVPVGAEGYEMMERGEASALIHLPENFTIDYLDGNPTSIKVVKNPSERFLPRVVDEGARIGAVGLSEASRIFRPELQQIGAFTNLEGFPADPAVAALSSGFNNKLSGLSEYLFPPIVELETTTLSNDAAKPASSGLNILSFILPGFAMMGILFLAQSATRDIMLDRESGRLRHLLTAPVSTTDYLAGKCLSVFAVTALGFLILLSIGLAVGVRWGPPLAVAALLLSSALAAGGLLLFIMSVVNSERQGDTLTTIVIIVSAMLGGAFVPISQMPEIIKPVSAATIVYWATEGFTKLITHGQGLADIMPNVIVLTVVGVLFMVVGATLLKRKIERRGVT